MPVLFRPRLTPLDGRLTPALGLDPTFGTAGVTLSADGVGIGVPTVAVQPDGRVLVGGTFDTVVTRFTADGRPDPTFGVNGKADPTPDRFRWLEQMATDAAGRVYLTGSWNYAAGTTTQGPPEPVLVRLTADGAPDPTFGTAGTLALTAGGLTSAHTLAVLPDGSVVVAGEGSRDGSRGYAAVRVTPGGKLDDTYGTGGGFFLAAPGVAYTRTATVTPDGGLAILGDSQGWQPDALYGADLSLLKLTKDGRLDTTFANGGVWASGAIDLGRDSLGLAVQPDGKLVAAGVRGTALTVVRLNADGTPDAGFGTGGAVTTPNARLGISAAIGPPNRVGLLANGTIVVGGAEISPNRVAVSLFTPTGAPAGTGLVGYDPTRVADGLRHFENGGGMAVAGDRVYLVADLSEVVPNSGVGRVGVAVLADRPDALPLLPRTTMPGSVLIDSPYTPPPVTELSVLPPVPGDLDGDRVPDVVVTTGPTVSVVSGKDGHVLVPAFAPFEASYTGTLNAVLADLTGDGVPELVVAPEQGGGPVVAVYDGTGAGLARFYGIDDVNFRGGARVAAGDLDGDGAADLIVTAGNGGGPRVAVYDGRQLAGTRRKLMGDFFAFEESQRGGATVAAGDVTGDGRADLTFGAGQGGGPRVLVLDGATLMTPKPKVVADFFADDPTARNGVTTVSVPRPGMVTTTTAGRLRTWPVLGS